jgi:hypothetical protein
MRSIKSAQQQQKHNHQSKLHFSTSPSVANKMFAKTLQGTAGVTSYSSSSLKLQFVQLDRKLKPRFTWSMTYIVLQSSRKRPEFNLVHDAMKECERI